MTAAPWLDSPLKRAIDLIVAVSAMVVLSPLIGFTAVMVRVRLGSPVLFRQRRAGRDATPIDIVKFRSMTPPTDGAGRTLSDADRLTPFGERLRSTSLDELPQFWSIARGDMSLVGPRPLPEQYVPRYSTEQRRRLRARPGLTGWAQVNGRNALDWPTKFAHDVWYVEHATWRVDLRIIAMTVLALLDRRGVSAEGHATMPEFVGET